MKRMLLLVIFCWAHAVQAQNITGVEYYIDTDPGFGNGTGVGITAGTDVTVGFTADLTGLDDGIHLLYVRSHDANGVWSLPLSQPFLKSSIGTNPAQNITHAEYYIDLDPGFGNATPIALSTSPDITVNFAVALNGVGTGLHTLNVRVRDATGVWSLVHARTFLKTPAQADPVPDITRVEYYVDTDPGFGNGTTVTPATGPDQTIAFTTNLNGVDAGIHVLYTRAQDAGGHWSLPLARSFLKTSVPSDPDKNITRTEYYIDTDPGFGNGTSVTLATGSDQTLNFLVDLNGLAFGFHNLYVRSQEASGQWSLPFAHAFLNEVVETDEPKSIIRAEYFIDADPGFGNATAISLTPGADLSLAFTADLNGITNGIHLLNVRTQDASGTWSLHHTRPFLMDNGVANDPPPPVTRIDYFFKKDNEVSTIRSFNNFTPSSDVGLGLGTFTANLSDLASGDWVMQAAAIDAVGRSSLLFTQSIEVTAAAIGDLTLDGVINITDVVALVQIILGQNPTPEGGSEAFSIADFNGDGTLNILDLIGQINTIIGVTVKPLVGAIQPVKLGLGDVEIGKDSRGLLPITLSSTGHVAGLQTDLIFDPALIEVGIPYLTDSYAHIQIEHDITDGTLRLLLYNAEGGALALAPGTELLVPVTLLDESTEDATVTLNETTLASAQARLLATISGVTTVAIRALPKEFSLSTNRPNPFNPSTQIAYDIPEQAHVTLILTMYWARRSSAWSTNRNNPAAMSPPGPVRTGQAVRLPAASISTVWLRAQAIPPSVG